MNHGRALIEVKRPGCANRLSPDQVKIHAQLKEMGFEPAVVTTTEQAFAHLRERGAPCAVRDWREAA